jgi:hypothetical protein
MADRLTRRPPAPRRATHRIRTSNPTVPPRSPRNRISVTSRPRAARFPEKVATYIGGGQIGDWAERGKTRRRRAACSRRGIVLRNQLQDPRQIARIQRAARKVADVREVENLFTRRGVPSPRRHSKRDPPPNARPRRRTANAPAGPSRPPTPCALCRAQLDDPERDNAKPDHGGERSDDRGPVSEEPLAQRRQNAVRTVAHHSDYGGDHDQR